jgi:hypothetical protein
VNISQVNVLGITVERALLVSSRAQLRSISLYLHRVRESVVEDLFRRLGGTSINAKANDKISLVTAILGGLRNRSPGGSAIHYQILEPQICDEVCIGFGRIRTGYCTVLAL